MNVEPLVVSMHLNNQGDMRELKLMTVVMHLVYMWAFIDVYLKLI